MKRSTTRILTTHTGSLPRPQGLLSLMIAEQAQPGTVRTALDAAIQRAVAEAVQKQTATGLDVINDGEHWSGEIWQEALMPYGEWCQSCRRRRCGRDESRAS